MDLDRIWPPDRTGLSAADLRMLHVRTPPEVSFSSCPLVREVVGGGREVRIWQAEERLIPWGVNYGWGIDTWRGGGPPSEDQIGRQVLDARKAYQEALGRDAGDAVAWASAMWRLADLWSEGGIAWKWFEMRELLPSAEQSVVELQFDHRHEARERIGAAWPLDQQAEPVDLHVVNAFQPPGRVVLVRLHVAAIRAGIAARYARQMVPEMSKRFVRRVVEVG